MIMNFWRQSTAQSKRDPRNGIERLTLKQRLGALTNLPRFLKLVYQTSPLITISNAIIRLCLAVLPLVMLYIGKLIIDQIINLVKHNNGDASHGHIWKLVIIEFALVVIMNALTKIVNLFDTLLGDLFANHTSLKIMARARGRYEVAWRRSRSAR